MSEVLKTFQPSRYFSIFIEKGVRPDGRALSTFAAAGINVGCVGTAEGSALVNIGETSVLCGIKAGLVAPSPENPGRGFLVPNVDFPPICSSRYLPGPPCEEVQIYSRLMVDLLEDSEGSSVVDSRDLCVVEGKLCWCLYVDITCLHHGGGNVLDACVLALMAALTNATLPEVSIAENGEINAVSYEKKKRLVLRDLVFSSTFGIFDNGVVADPTVEEEITASGIISLFTKENGMICNTFMPRGSPVSEECLKHCVNMAKKRSKKLAGLVRNLELSNNDKN